jgi:hypothetical protein
MASQNPQTNDQVSLPAGELEDHSLGLQAAQIAGPKRGFHDLTKGDYFDYVYKSGLLRCRDCPIADAPSHRKAVP